MFSDATSANEAVNLQNRLRTLSSGLVGLRNCIHDQQQQNGVSTMTTEVAMNSAENGLNRISSDSGPTSPLNGAFPSTANDGGVIMNGTMLSAIPPPPPAGSSVTGNENGAILSQSSSHFPHGKLLNIIKIII